MKKFLALLFALTFLFSFFPKIILPVSHAADFTYDVNSLNAVDDSTCDGAHCSLHEAIDAANADGGSSEITFSVTGTVDYTGGPAINAPVDITGPGRSDLTITGGGFFFNTSGGGSSTVSALTIDTDTLNIFTGTSGPVIFDDIEFGALEIQNSGGHTIQNSTFNDTNSGGYYALGSGGNITLNNNIINAGGIILMDDGNVVTNNTFEDGGIGVSGPATFTNGTIEGNTFNGGDIGIGQFDTVSIVGNTFNNNHGLQSGWGGTASNLTISGNTFNCTADSTIFYIQGGDPATGIVFDDSSGTGNIINDCGGSSVAAYADDASIKGNTFDNSGIRILRGGASAEELFVIENNTFTPLGDFHAINGSFNDPLQYVDVIGNTVDCSLNADAKGIDITNSNASYLNFGDALVEAEGNTFIDCEFYGGAFVFDGTNITVGYNDFGSSGIITGDVMENSTVVYNTVPGGMSFRMDSNNTVSNNTVGTWIGIWMQGVGNTISNNNISINAGGNGILMSVDGDIAGGTNTISGNTITAGTGGTGIAITGNDTGSIQDLIIDGNILTGPFSPLGVSIVNMNEEGESSDITIQNNQISGSTAFGMLIQNYVGALTVSGNTIENSDWEGIYIDDDATLEATSTITDNILTGNAMGLSIGSTEGISGSGNTYTNNTTSGIEFRSSDNSFSDETITGGTYGITFNGETNDSENNIVADSSISGTTTADLYSTNVGPGTTGTNTINNVSFSDYEVTDGILDINFKARIQALSGASTSATSASSVLTPLGTIDGSGFTAYNLLDAYQVDSTGVINSSNPYYFAASKTGYSTGSSSTSITTANQTVIIGLTLAPTGGPSGGYVGGGDDDDDEESTPTPTTEPVSTPEEEKIVEAINEAGNSVTNEISNIIDTVTGDDDDSTQATIKTEETESQTFESVLESVETYETSKPSENTEIPSTTTPTESSTSTSTAADDTIFIYDEEGQLTEVNINDLELTNNSDIDRDGISDLLAIEYGIPLFNEDPDNDGFTNADELFLGTNPLVANPAPTTPRIINLDQAIVGPHPSFHLSSKVGDEVEVIVVAVGNSNEISIGSTTIDEKHKGEINTKNPLKPGEYFGVPKGQNGFGKAVKFTVEKSAPLEAPKFTDASRKLSQNPYGIKLARIIAWVLNYHDDNYNEFHLDRFLAKHDSRFNNNPLIIRGYAKANTPVYIALKSVIYSSVVLADANGYFEAYVYDKNLDLNKEKHSVLGYVSDTQKKLLSDVTILELLIP